MNNYELYNMIYVEFDITKAATTKSIGREFNNYNI